MDVETVADGIHRFGDGIVNCYALEDERGVTLVDALFPRSDRQVAAGLERIGRRISDVRAVLITHGHPDHLGVAERFASKRGVPVRSHPDEFDLLRGERRQSAPPGLVLGMLRYLAHPQAWRMIGHGVRCGFLRPRWVSAPVAVADGEALDVPGRPVAVATPGHTRGHLSFHLPQAGAVISGDALTTLDVMTGKRGPRVESLSEDLPRARESLARLARLDADLLLPGHGSPWRGPIADAAAEAAVASRP